MRIFILVSLALVALACGSSSTGGTTCISGAQAACSCTDGKMGAQTCTVGGTFDACVCTGGAGGGGGTACSAANCSGCCESSGACQSGTNSSSCGKGGQTCSACTTTQACTSGSCAASSGKRIFVTATSYIGGNLGGLAGADAKCNLSAQGATLGGTWKAWLSDFPTNAIDRITDVGPWFLVGTTTKVFNNKANLTTVPLQAINRNEQGNVVDSANYIPVWTGTESDGTKALNTCSSWTDVLSRGSTGYVQMASGWTAPGAGTLSCASSHQIYCIEQ